MVPKRDIQAKRLQLLRGSPNMKEPFKILDKTFEITSKFHQFNFWIFFNKINREFVWMVFTTLSNATNVGSKFAILQWFFTSAWNKRTENYLIFAAGKNSYRNLFTNFKLRQELDKELQKKSLRESGKTQNIVTRRYL